MASFLEEKKRLNKKIIFSFIFFFFFLFFIKREPSLQAKSVFKRLLMEQSPSKESTQKAFNKSTVEEEEKELSLNKLSIQQDTNYVGITITDEDNIKTPFGPSVYKTIKKSAFININALNETQIQQRQLLMNRTQLMKNNYRHGVNTQENK